MFAVGSAIVAVKNHFTKLCRLTAGKEYVVIKCDNSYVVVVDDRNKEVTCFLHRFTKKEEAVPVKGGIFAGSRIICTDDARCMLVFGAEYVATKVANDKVLIDGKWYSISRFRLSDNQEAVPVQKKIEKKEKTLLKSLCDKVGDIAGTCSYAIQFEGGRIRYEVRDVCHARIYYPSYTREAVEKKATAVALNVKGHVARSGAAYPDYVDYIINESPWASVFTGDKNLQTVLNSGIYLDVNRTVSELVCSAVALRAGSEFSFNNKLFKELSDMGFNKHVCWIVSQCFKQEGENYIFSSLGGGHHVLATTMDLDEVVAFFKTGKFRNQENVRPYKENGRGYAILSSMAEESGNDISNFVKKHPKAEKIPENWGWFKYRFGFPGFLSLVNTLQAKFY